MWVLSIRTSAGGPPAAAGSKRPRMYVVQAEGCAPIVRAFQLGERHAERWENAHTVAAGIRVPRAIGDFLILDAVRASGASAIAVPGREIVAEIDSSAEKKDSCCALKARPLLSPPNTHAKPARFGSMKRSCCSIAQPHSNTRCLTGLCSMASIEALGQTGVDIWPAPNGSFDLIGKLWERFPQSGGHYTDDLMLECASPACPRASSARAGHRILWGLSTFRHWDGRLSS